MGKGKVLRFIGWLLVIAIVGAIPILAYIASLPKPPSLW
jgi:hypothetical protein